MTEMTATTTQGGRGFVPRAVGTPNRGAIRPTVVLALREAMLLVRHPLHVAGVALTLVVVALSVQRNADTLDAYFGAGNAVVMFEGNLTYFAAYLCASRNDRSNVDAWISTTVLSPASRTAAMCLAAVAPFGIACAVLAVLDPAVAEWSGRSADPGVLRLLGAALCVLGAALLGVLVSRWCPVSGAAFAVFAGLIALSAWLHMHVSTLLQPMTAWPSWPPWLPKEQPYVGVIPGSPGWHALFILGLCALAVCGAMVVHRPWRYPAIAIGMLVAACTVLAGWAQLP